MLTLDEAQFETLVVAEPGPNSDAARSAAASAVSSYPFAV